MMMDLTLHPIGIVRSPYIQREDTPRQGRLSENIVEIHIQKEYLPGLLLVSEKRYLFILCWFDRSDRTVLRVTPPRKEVEHGVFATRSPDRPNPISLTLVELVSIREDGVLQVKGLEAMDGTPVLDIKPYSARIDTVPESFGTDDPVINT